MIETILRATSYGRRLTIGQTQDGCIGIILETEDLKEGVRCEISPKNQIDSILEEKINNLLIELTEVIDAEDPKWFWD